VPDPAVEQFAQAHDLAVVLKFGSTVGGAVHPASDLDVAVLFGRSPVGFEERARVAHELQVLFPGREVDLAVLDHADPLFLKKVLERCELLAGSPRRLAELKM
jgi:predicted nucleotidyltransferase